MSRTTADPRPARLPACPTPVPWPAAVLARGRLVVPGLVLALFVALAATPLGHAVPVVGAPVFGI
ncbi:MAG TPA: hypothetical protein VGL33_15570, partial [Streptosporangiaceae bacterium]